MTTTAQLQRALAFWIVNVHRSETVRLSSGSDGLWQITAVMYELWDDTDVLPRAVVDELGLRPTATYGHIAQLLWTLCCDEKGPSHTHRAALALLRDFPSTHVGAGV